LGCGQPAPPSWSPLPRGSTAIAPPPRSMLAGPPATAAARTAAEEPMASETTGNGPAAPSTSGAEPGQAQHQLIINAQYIKDLSFENPRAPASLRQQTGMPAVDINVDVKAQGIAPDNYEVVLTITATAKAQDETMFIVELAYAGLVTV